MAQTQPPSLFERVAAAVRLWAAAVLVLVALPALARGQGIDGETSLVDMLRLHDYEADPTPRFVVVTAICLILSFVIWYVHKLVVRRRRRVQRARRGRSVRITGLREGESSVQWTLPPLPIDLEVEVFGTEELAGFCARGVIAHRDPQLLVFHMVDEHIELPWRPGNSVQVYFWRPEDAGYLFTTEVIELRLVGSGYLVVAPPRSMERHQRRLHVRVAVSEWVDFLHIPAGDVGFRLGREGTDSGGLHPGEIEDLSAGGIRLTAGVSMAPDDFVCFASFPAIPGNEVLTRIVDEKPIGTSDGNRRYGLRYVGMSSALRDEITRQVFRIQRERLASQKAMPPTAPAPVSQHLDTASDDS